MWPRERSESLQRDRSTGYQVPNGTFATFIVEASKQFSSVRHSPCSAVAWNEQKLAVMRTYRDRFAEETRSLSRVGYEKRGQIIAESLIRMLMPLRTQMPQKSILHVYSTTLTSYEWILSRACNTFDKVERASERTIDKEDFKKTIYVKCIYIYIYTHVVNWRYIDY